jgi:hypothetical protein
VGISVAADGASDGRGHRGQLVVGQVNCRHGLSPSSSSSAAPNNSTMSDDDDIVVVNVRRRRRRLSPMSSTMGATGAGA